MKRFYTFFFLIFLNFFFFSYGESFMRKEKERKNMKKEKIVTKKEEEEEEFITHVTLTVYNPVKEQCDSDPLITANGTKIDLQKLKKGEIKYCAVSRNLLWYLPYGSIIHIEGFGEYLVVDTMHKRFNHHIDILQDENEPIFKKTNVKIIRIYKGNNNKNIKCEYYG